MSVGEVKQPGLNPNTSGAEKVTQLGDPLLSLIGGDEIGKLSPPADGFEAVGMRLDVRRGAQRDRCSGAGLPERAKGRLARSGGEGLHTGIVVRMQMKNLRPDVHRGSSLVCELSRRTGNERMFLLSARAIQTCLKHHRS